MRRWRELARALPWEREELVVEARFLAEAHGLLTRAELNGAEDMYFGSGPSWGRTRILDRLVGFEKVEQSRSGVVGDAAAVGRALLELESWGQRVHAVIHVHPGKGPGACNPSGVDRDYMRRMAALGYRVPGFVFSQDPWARVFGAPGVRLPRLRVVGTGAEIVRPGLLYVDWR